MDRLTPKEMIQAIKSNYPDTSRYSMLCEALIHAIELLQAESEGRLIILPCKVGDTVYKVWYAPCKNGETYPDGVNCDGCMDVCDIHKVVTEYTVPNVNFIWVNFVMHGNTVYFLTREEAEAARGGADNGM